MADEGVIHSNNTPCMEGRREESKVSWSQLMASLERPLIEGPSKLKENKALILELLESYEANLSDFHRFCHFDEKAYTKNLVKASSDDTYNVIIMCWAANQCSLFHGHEGSSCFVKVLEGEMLEQLVPHPATAWPPPQEAPKRGREKVLRQNDVSYIDDNIGVHKMINLKADSAAVTLHIYLPAYKQCRIFRASTKDAKEPEEAIQDVSLKMEESECIEVTLSSRSH